MGRPKKEIAPVAEVKTTSTTRTVNKPTQREKDLELQVASLTKMMQELQTLIVAKEKETAEPIKTFSESLPVSSVFTLQEDQVKEAIPFREYIRVMSLTNHRLSLSTEAYGQGTVYNFTNFGQVQSIFYDELAKIIHNNDRFTREGYFYILDPRVIRIHNLVEDYKKIVDKDTIVNILNLPVESIRTLMNDSTPHCRKTIASIILDKLIANESMDLNKVRVISETSGSDVEEIVKKIKEAQQES